MFSLGPHAVRGLVDLVLGHRAATRSRGTAGLRTATSTGNVTAGSRIQSRVPEDLRGRAFAGVDMLWQTGRPLSLLGGGLLADTVGIRAVYLLGGLLLLTAAAVGAVAAETTSRSTPLPS